jgi:hypothetical protein
LPYTLACTVKSRLILTSILMTKREEKEEKRCVSLALAGLSSYLCRLCTLCVHLSVLGVVSTPPHYVAVESARYVRCLTLDGRGDESSV